MSVYDLHFNKDDVTLRNILIGLLATLHESIFWYNQIGVNVQDKRQIKVPFYFSTTGTERYLQDNFLNNIDFDPENLKAESFYNKIPRGIVDLTGINVEAQNIVNKYVRMNHQVQEDDGTLNTYSTEAFWVPILLNLDATVYTDSILDQLKCTEAVIKTFFKSKAFQIDVAYTRIPCLVVFPDDYSNERTLEFSFTDKREFVTKFSLQVKTHIPIFREGTSIFAGTTMEGFQSNSFVTPVTFGPEGGANNGPTVATDSFTPNTQGSGGTALYENLAGNPVPEGFTGNSLTSNPNPNDSYPGNVDPGTRPWPEIGGGSIPPGGGTANG